MLALLLVTVLGCGDLCSAQAGRWYDDLLAAGGFGWLQRERAAFLIRERDGALTLAPWDPGGYRHATFRGSLPARVIAIVHTHPKDTPAPSAHDREEARRLDVPVLVVTPSGVIAAMPDGGNLQIR